MRDRGRQLVIGTLAALAVASAAGSALYRVNQQRSPGGASGLHGVAPRSIAAGMLPRRVLPAERRAPPGATAHSVEASITQWGYRRSRYPPRLKPPGQRDDGFSFCRLMYQSGRWGRGRWSTDYPFADINFMVRVSELTYTPVNFNDRGEPNHWVVPVTDDALFSCPFIVASAVGTMVLSPEEVVRLREYLLKGGFLWADDFWGTQEWEQWEAEIGKVLPPAQYPIVELPLEHPLFHGMFYIWEIPQISNIGFWRSTGGTSERGADSTVPHFRTIHDEDGRIMVAMTHNTDIQDAWEREGEDQGFFEQFSPDGYALGVNVLLHAMTH